MYRWNIFVLNYDDSSTGSPKVVWRFQFHSTGQLDKFISRIILWFLRWQLSWKARSLRCVNIIENSSREHSASNSFLPFYLPFFPKYERHFLKRKHLWQPQLKIKISGAHLPTIFNLNHTELLLSIIIKHLILQRQSSLSHLNANKMASKSRSRKSISHRFIPLPRAETRVFEHEMDIII